MAALPTAQQACADVIVIGAGHNGLVAACYLARRGLDVVVVEAADAVGGCTSTANVIAQAPEHKINLCSVDFLWIRASSVVADLDLVRFGYVDIDLDPAFVHLNPDGPSIAVWRDPRRTADEIRRFSAHDAEAYLDFARAQDALMDVMFPLMLNHPTRPPARALFSAFSAAALNARSVFGLRDLLATPAVEIIARRFQHPIVKDMLAGMAAIAAPITGNGSGLTLMFGAMVHRLGMGRPLGGSQALPDALVRCLASHGGRVRTAAVVEELLAGDGKVSGVRLADGEQMTARAVLSSCDPKTTLTRLLPAGVLSDKLAARVENIPTKNQGAAHVKIDLALKGRLELRRHQEWRKDDLDLRKPSMFTGTLEEFVAALEQARGGAIPNPLPFWGIVPTALDPTQAPDGQDTLYLWSGWMPSDPPRGWDANSAAAADALVASAARFYDNVAELELGRYVKTPLDLARQMRLSDGQPWHVDFARTALGPLRPALGFGSYKTPVEGLFLTGAGTHPCPGVSGIPGQLAAAEVLRTLTSSRAPDD